MLATSEFNSWLHHWTQVEIKATNQEEMTGGEFREGDDLESAENAMDARRNEEETKKRKKEK